VLTGTVWSVSELLPNLDALLRALATVGPAPARGDALDLAGSVAGAETWDEVESALIETVRTWAEP
jgi:hypothetical protein